MAANYLAFIVYVHNLAGVVIIRQQFHDAEQLDKFILRVDKNTVASFNYLDVAFDYLLEEFGDRFAAKKA